MHEKEKDLRAVYSNARSGLTLKPEDFGFILDQKTGQLIEIESKEKITEDEN
jgi:hypothetical protein